MSRRTVPRSLDDVTPAMVAAALRKLTRRVLIGCARSGVMARAFRAQGWEAWECDTQPTRDVANRQWHLQGDVLWFAENHYPFDLFICHPECRYLSVSGLHWNRRRPERAAETERAIQFFIQCACLPIAHKCLENPVGIMSTRWRKPDQIIQPFQFGDDASKATCLWLENLPLLIPTKRIAGRMVNGRERWSNQTDSGQNRLGSSPTRAEERARTYPGIAAAMAQQWTAFFS